MKTNIRQSVFETNSSSIHSIAVKRGTKDQGIEYVTKRDGAIAFNLGQFGWKAMKHTSIVKRASYLWTLACSDTIKEANKRERFIRETLNEVGIKCVFQPVVQKVYESGWECCVAEDGEYFYIDHSDSWGNLTDKIFSDKDFLLDFLFGDSYVITYNDNDDYDDWLYAEDDGVDRDEYDKFN